MASTAGLLRYWAGFVLFSVVDSLLLVFVSNGWMRVGRYVFHCLLVADNRCWPTGMAFTCLTPNKNTTRTFSLKVGYWISTNSQCVDLLDLSITSPHYFHCILLDLIYFLLLTTISLHYCDLCTDNHNFKMDMLLDLDEDTLFAVLAIYRADIAKTKEKKAVARRRNRDETANDKLAAIKIHLDEVERQATVAKDHRMAQSIIDAKLTDTNVIAAFAEEEKRAHDDRQYARTFAGGAAGVDPAGDNQPTPEQVIEASSTPTMSKLAGLWVSEEAGRAFHPSGKQQTVIDGDSEGRMQDEWVVERSVLEATCISCTEKKSYFEVLPVPCGHLYCRQCIHELFETSFTDNTLFPPRCCRQNILPTDIDIFMRRELSEKFDEKEIEFNTTDKTYCANKTCTAFILPSTIANEIAHCQKCDTKTCLHCKNEEHDGECPEDSSLQVTLELAKEQGWRRCPRCQTMVELRTGCWHITCTCGNHFCYNCGVQPWKSCRCDQWDEARLVERAEEIVRREGGPVDAAAIRAAAENLRDGHECEHRGWYDVDPGDCDECGDYMPIWLNRCYGCRLELCRRCRNNRLR